MMIRRTTTTTLASCALLLWVVSTIGNNSNSVEAFTTTTSMTMTMTTTTTATTPRAVAFGKNGRTTTRNTLTRNWSMASMEEAGTTTTTKTTTDNNNNNNNNDEDDDDDDKSAIFEQLGIEPGKLALGIRPADVLKYIGTRQDLITKTKTDIPTFSLEQATIEADKFLLDAEMLDLFIRLGKELEKDPNFTVPDPSGEPEGLFSVRNIVIAYGSFVTVTNGPDLIRGYIADQQVAGTWHPTGLPFIDHWVDDTNAVAMAAALGRAAASSAVSAAASAADTAATTLVETSVLATP